MTGPTPTTLLFRAQVAAERGALEGSRAGVNELESIARTDTAKGDVALLPSPGQPPDFICNFNRAFVCLVVEKTPSSYSAKPHSNWPRLGTSYDSPIKIRFVIRDSGNTDQPKQVGRSCVKTKR